MKNREQIKQAVLFSICETARDECKKNGLTKNQILRHLDDNKEKYEILSEHLLNEYDSFLIDTLAGDLSNKLKDSVEKDNEIFSKNFQTILNTVQYNHSQTCSHFSDLSNYHLLVREKILDEEIIHLQEDCDILKKHQQALQSIAKAEANKISWLFVFLSSISLIFWIGLIYKNGWDKMEQWTYISGGILVLLNGLFFAIYEKNFTRKDLQNEKFQKSLQHTYKLYKFDEKLIIRYQKELENKKDEIERIKQEKLSLTMDSTP